jgi:hypothetical protein
MNSQAGTQSLFKQAKNTEIRVIQCVLNALSVPDLEFIPSRPGGQVRLGNRIIFLTFIKTRQVLPKNWAAPGRKVAVESLAQLCYTVRHLPSGALSTGQYR